MSQENFDNQNEKPEVFILWEGRTEGGNYRKIFQIGNDPQNLIEAVRFDASAETKPLVLDLGYSTPFDLRITGVHYARSPLSLNSADIKSSYFKIIPSNGKAKQVSCETKLGQNCVGKKLEIETTCFKEFGKDWRTWRVEENRDFKKENLPLDPLIAERVGCSFSVREDVLVNVGQGRNAKTFLFDVYYPSLFERDPMNPAEDNPSQTPEPSFMQGEAVVLGGADLIKAPAKGDKNR
ncbi:MAG: hypothetical protein V1746_07865 [bacterium]